MGAEPPSPRGGRARTRASATEALRTPHPLLYESDAARAEPGPACARRWPPYAACVALELFESPGPARDGPAGEGGPGMGHVVRLRYQDRPVGMLGHGRPPRAHPHPHPHPHAHSRPRKCECIHNQQARGGALRAGTGAHARGGRRGWGGGAGAEGLPWPEFRRLVAELVPPLPDAAAAGPR